MFAVFLEPKGIFRNEILKWKELVQKVLPNQPYALHPPHCTLISTDVEDEEKAQTNVINSLKGIDPFKIKTDGHMFSGMTHLQLDIQSAGNSTLISSCFIFKN